MQKPMIHWLLHSIGDSHVVFVTLSSRTYVRISPMLTEQTRGSLPARMFSTGKCSVESLMNLICVCEVEVGCWNNVFLIKFFRFWGGKKPWNVSVTVAATLSLQIHECIKCFRLHFGYKEEKHFQLVMNPRLLLTTWLTGTTSPEQRDEHQPHNNPSTNKQKT